MSRPKPAITFQVNTETLNRQGGILPNNIQLNGNETVSEADEQKNTRSIAFIPGANAGMNVTGYSHGQTFTLYGNDALYIKRLYCLGTVDSLLSVVTESWTDAAVA